jgi:hypothetical protein
VNRRSKTTHRSIDSCQHTHCVECSPQKPQLHNPHACRLHNRSVDAAAVKTSKGARRWDGSSGSIAEPAGRCGPNQQKRRWRLVDPSPRPPRGTRYEPALCRLSNERDRRSRCSSACAPVCSRPNIRATVPWRCPACHLPIRHNELETMPRPGERYRCHVCRLELVMDPIAGRLTVPVIEADPPRAIAPDTSRKRSRSK